MKKTILDIEAIHEELDAEDAELFAIFRGRERVDMNDLLLVTKGGNMHLERKSDIARRKKNVRAALSMAQAVGSFVCMGAALLSASGGGAEPWLWLGGFLACFMPYIFRVPYTVHG